MGDAIKYCQPQSNPMRPVQVRSTVDPGRLRRIIEKDANVVGAATRLAQSFRQLRASPEFGVGAIAVGASGAYQRMGAEIANRLPAPREQARVGGVLALGAEMLKSKL
ncbi:MAG: hypothetical protein F4W89_02195 [Acidobacteria bacterium]|nr:hypothetical protein [Acidobacteriota bacterium]